MLQELLILSFASLTLFPIGLIMAAKNCCCDPTCLRFNDNFDSDRLATSYSVRSGSFSVDTAAGALNTSSDGAVLRCETTVSNKGTVTCTVSVDTVGAVFRLFGSVVDDDNCVFLEANYNGAGSSLKVYSRAGGVNTLLGTRTITYTASPLGLLTFRLCWNGHHVSVFGGQPFSDDVYEYTGTGTKASVGGDANGGTIYGWNFSLSEHFDTNPACQKCNDFCVGNSCTETSGTTFISAELTGVANGTCATCNGLNAVYLLQHGNGISAGGATQQFCVWPLAIPGVCGINHVQWNPVFSGSEAAMQMRASPIASGEAAAWIIPNGSGLVPIDCGSQTIPAPPTTTSGLRCDYSGASWVLG